MASQNKNTQHPSKFLLTTQHTINFRQVLLEQYSHLCTLKTKLPRIYNTIQNSFSGKKKKIKKKIFFQNEDKSIF